MASSNIKLRSSCSFLHLLISFFSFVLFILSAASLAPTIALRTPPSSLGYAFLLISSISILSSFLGFYSQLNHFCYITHVSLLLASSTAQLLGIFALFTKEKSSLSMFRSGRDPREAKLLVRLECGILMAMFLMQSAVLLLCCAVHRCWVREYEGLEAERDATAQKRRRNIARVQEESMEEKMKTKYGVLSNNNEFQP